MTAPLTAPQAAAYLHMGLTKFRSLVAAGEIARTGDDGRHLFLEADLDDWLRRRRRPAKAERARPMPRPASIGERPDPEAVRALFGVAR